MLFVAAFRLPGGVAATAGAFQPLAAAGIAAVVLREVFTRRTAVAGTAGVAGVAMLVLGPDAALDPIGVSAAIAGTLCMATGVVLTKHWGRPVDLVTFTGWQLSAGGLLLVPVLVATEGFPPTVTAVNIVGFTWLATIGTGLAYANWFAGIQRLPINTVSFLGLLSPLVAAIAGWAILDETLTTTQLAGAALVLAAVIAPHLPCVSKQSTDPTSLEGAVSGARVLRSDRPVDVGKRVRSVTAVGTGVDAVLEVGGEGRVLFAESGDGVADGASDSHSGPLGIAADGAESAVEANGPGELCDQEIAIALGEFGTHDIVVGECGLDVFVDVGKSSPIGQPRLIVDRRYSVAAQTLDRELRGACRVHCGQ